MQLSFSFAADMAELFENMSKSKNIVNIHQKYYCDPLEISSKAHWKYCTDSLENGQDSLKILRRLTEKK